MKASHESLVGIAKLSFTFLGVFAMVAFLSYQASDNGNFFRSAPYQSRNTTADATLSRLTNGAGAWILDGVVATVKANALEKGGDPFNAVAYNSYIDSYLNLVDRLDNETKAELWPDYAFLFQYIYPRVYELKNDPIANIVNKLKSGANTGSVSVNVPTASFTIDGLQNATLTVGQSHQKAWTSTGGTSWNTTYEFSQDPTNTTPCSQKDSNGNWLSGTWAWTDGLAGNTAQGLVTNAPIADKVGCVTTFVYTVTNSAWSASSTATMKVVPVETPTSSWSISITTPSVLHRISSGHLWGYTIVHTGSVGIPTWSLIAGNLPPTMELNSMSGTINNFNAKNQTIPAGTYDFTLKVAVDSSFATKQFTIEVVPSSDKRPLLPFGINYGSSYDKPIPVAVGFEVNCGWSPSGCSLGHIGNADETANPICTVVSGRLPQGVEMVNHIGVYKGCSLVGVPRESGDFLVTWSVQTEFGSDSTELHIQSSVPKQTYRLATYGIPDATVGVPYSFKLRYETTGNPDISIARFGVRNGLPDGLSIDGITGEITGTPTTPGTYDVAIDYGISTAQFLSGRMELQPFIIKPRTQTQEETNLDIDSAVKMFTWTTKKAEDAAALRILMVKHGWTLMDVTTALTSAGYWWNMGDIAKVLYPDTSERGWALRGEIDKAISKSDWSETTKHQSALNFRSVMVANGWTLPDILFGKYTLSGWGVAENEIKKVIDANPIE